MGEREEGAGGQAVAQMARALEGGRPPVGSEKEAFQTRADRSARKQGAALACGRDDLPLDGGVSGRDDHLELPSQEFMIRSPCDCLHSSFPILSAGLNGARHASV